MMMIIIIIIIIINGANWFFISHLCSFLMWSCSLLPLPILAIQTLASSLYLCSPFVVPSIRPFPLPIPAILSSLPLSPTSQKCNNAFGATVGGRNVASILSVFGPEVQSLPPPFPPNLILKLRGVLKDKRGEMTKCCITPVCTNIKTGGEKGGRQGACFPTPTQLGRIEERGSCNILSTNRLAKQFFDQNYMTI